MDDCSSDHDAVLGVDIGGTKVAVGIVDSKGQILSQSRSPMVANGTAEDALEAVTAAIDTLFFLAKIPNIGVCAPGPLDPRKGAVLNPPNLPCWRNFPLAQRIADAYHVPVMVDNDANAAALAETRWGAGRNRRYVFYTCIGTGIGTGIVLEGRIYHGNTGAAGEGGHVSIDYRGPVCACGKRGCIEIMAAGPAIAARARGKFEQGSCLRSAILDLAGGDVGKITSEFVGRACAIGDPLAREILEETVAVVTPWLGNIVDLLDPDVIVMGGGVATMLQPFFAEIKSRLPGWCVNPRAFEIPLVIAHYGADAGIAGGAALCSGSR